MGGFFFFVWISIFYAFLSAYRYKCGTRARAQCTFLFPRDLPPALPLLCPPSPPHTHAAVPPPLAHLPMTQGDVLVESPTVKERRRGKERGGKLGSLPTDGDMDGSTSTVNLANIFESVRKQNRGHSRLAPSTGSRASVEKGKGSWGRYLSHPPPRY